MLPVHGKRRNALLSGPPIKLSRLQGLEFYWRFEPLLCSLMQDGGKRYRVGTSVLTS